MTGMVIRPAETGDAPAIRALLVAAFKGAIEADLVDELAWDGDLTLALVAEDEAAIVGYLACSPLVFDGGSAQGQALAPVAVAPSRQGQGIGSALIEAAHARLRGEGVDFILVLGDPAYYGRFGYSALAAVPFETPYDGPYLQALAFSERGAVAAGRVTYAKAFQRLDGAQ